jgi:hypothetical protein
MAQTFDTRQVGSNKTLTVSAHTVNDGNTGHNYTVTLLANHTGVITKLPLSVSGVTANNKPFDGYNTATLNFSGAALVGVLSPDVVTLTTGGATGTFPTPNVGGPYTVTIAGLGLAGADSGNYSLTQPTATASIGAWTLSGFFQPVGAFPNTIPNTPAEMAPMAPTNSVWNTIKGGQTVPLKFELFATAGGTELTSVSDVQSFTVSGALCSAGYEDWVETSVTPTGGTVLRYTDGQFIQNWDSPKGAGKCFRVTMTARDGSKLSAFFKTK